MHKNNTLLIEQTQVFRTCLWLFYVSGTAFTRQKHEEASMILLKKVNRDQVLT